jgi:hypothetical protein
MQVAWIFFLHTTPVEKKKKKSYFANLNETMHIDVSVNLT